LASLKIVDGKSGESEKIGDCIISQLIPCTKSNIFMMTMIQPTLAKLATLVKLSKIASNMASSPDEQKPNFSQLA